MTQNSLSKSNISGFTIIELMIATTVFSVILLIATMALIQIGRVYYKGVLSAKTQNTARAIVDEIGSSIKFSGGDVVTPLPGDNVLCIGDLRYTFNINHMLEDTGDFVLIADKKVPCRTDDPFNSGDTCDPPACRELLAPRMRLATFDVVNDPVSSNMYRIKIGVISGDDDLLDPGDNTRCGVSINAGGQFCAASELTTYVQKRI